MGANQAKLAPEEIQDIRTKTDNKLSEKEIKDWYKGFMNDNPEGWLGVDEFKKIYGNFFPYGKADKFAEQVFRSFDTDKNGQMDFSEFLTALSVTSRGGMEAKLKWAFDMYDQDGNGDIDKKEMVDIIDAMFMMCGNIVESNETPESLTEKIFVEMDTDGNGSLSKEEFVEGAKQNPTLMKLMTMSS